MKTSNGKTSMIRTLCAAVAGLTAVTVASAAAPAAAPKAKPTHLAAAAPSAPRAGCVELKSVAQTEQETRDEKGQKVVRLVPAASIVPGTQVVWTITASNVCDTPAANVLIDNPVPEHMSFVADSAIGAGAAISYSLDGKRFAAPDALQVRESAEVTRTARADEYTHIRWAFQNAIAPGQVAVARFRATVK